MLFRLDLVGIAEDFFLDCVALSDELTEGLGEIHVDCGIASVALSCASIERMSQFNESYRGIGEPTDVLAFPLWEEGGKFAPPEAWDELPLGDVIVSPGFVRQKTGIAGAGCDEEIARLVIHGVLHLIGFDHDTEDREAEMWDLQESILEKYVSRVNGRGGLMAE
ncbi:MAG: rRNA maturation RNase YbeY [Synergistaceae bacterium]|jgi:probable rRNA maturation factor|nr:rRNA maturation RNase YbeY [Synergistaceae bacterium]